jgi:uncharacterized protein (DUF305 family)
MLVVEYGYMQINTQTKVLWGVTVALALVVGILIGQPTDGRNDAYGMHRMPDGRMMKNHGDMASMMHDMNASLEGKVGDDFDKAFLQEMIVHHEGAVAMAEKVLEVSKKEELRSLATDIITAQNKEIEMMATWLATWFK